MARKKRQKTETVSHTVGFVALGCPKNMVDAETMLARIGMAGFILTDDIDNADVVVINTCGFIAPAKEEALEAIRNALQQKKKGCIRKVIVTGCLAERLGEELLHEVEDVDAIVSLAGRDNIDNVIKETLTEVQSRSSQLYIAPTPTFIPDDRDRLRITPTHWAYLRISEGCNRKCSFCTIPAIRGKFRSKPIEWILDEARRLIDSGAVELSLIAQDSNFYGRDLGIKNGLLGLLTELEKIPSLKWIRLMYLYPSGIDDDLIAAIANSPKVVHYIDMPIQHSSDAILKNMHRTHTQKSTADIIDKIRKAIPDIVLRTTVIAGFPGESDAQFRDLLAFIRWVRFDALGCFPYYPEVGTPAATLAGQLPSEVRKDRANQIMRTQQQIAFEKAKARIGSRLTVLVDEQDRKCSEGRFYGQAPHIDSVCLIQNKSFEPGTWVETEVIGYNGYDLLVRPC